MTKIVSIKNTMMSRNTPTLRKTNFNRKQNLMGTSPHLRPVSQFEIKKNSRNKKSKDFIWDINTKMSVYQTNITGSSRAERSCERFLTATKNFSPPPDIIINRWVDMLSFSLYSNYFITKLTFHRHMLQIMTHFSPINKIPISY